MNELEKQLLAEETGGAGIDLCIRTKSRIDAGRWWRRTPLWLCTVGNEILILAVARRRHSERISLADCDASHYSHATGELVLAPAESLTVRHLAMSPRDALAVLAFLKKTPRNHVTETKT